MKQELAWADYTQLQTMQIKLHILTITYNVSCLPSTQIGIRSGPVLPKLTV